MIIQWDICLLNMLDPYPFMELVMCDHDIGSGTCTFLKDKVALTPPPPEFLDDMKVGSSHFPGNRDSMGTL